MTTPVKCEECDGRGWKIVTRRGCVAATVLRMETSSREDCLYCDGAEQVIEMFEWEVFLSANGTDQLGPCGTSSSQAASMDDLRMALRRLAANTGAWGRITHRLYDFGTVPDDWSRRVIFKATVDPAGSVRFERVAS
ncbi:hypothetical protein FHS43_006128 [Streptosporangium becharense]|uniref:Uncharacterized protein n=1 Tax=Streptosporangium becharense TaxID=1816182 RepID=A0A7W9IHT7_9ACTN|nr:hypothetical protein [Streptosporangium becharense]MBB2914816.1 hypothetical protein [Streptosporangium becharense]MBB5820373.1 hypothetical protein [Streptosporangium becharense]